MLDARLALRLLARDPVFTATAAVVLALGIGVNNMFFTLVYAHTMRGLPIAHPERVLFVSTLDERAIDRPVSIPDFEDISAAQQSFVGLAAFMNAPVALGDEGRTPDRYEGAYVSANAFPLVGALPSLGRGFSLDDDRIGGPPVVVLGEGVWQARYGRDPSVLERSVFINGAPFTVIGVLPERSGVPSTAGVWLPLGQMPGINRVARGARTMRVFGRVRDGVEVPDATAEIQALADGLARQYPNTNANVRARAVPINERFMGRLEGAWLAFITAGLVIVAIACANAANLMLARAADRTPELAIRLSLGASRWRVVRQLLFESTVLAALGGIAGLGLSIGGVRVFRLAIPDNVLPYWIDYSADRRVVAALVAVSCVVVFLFGLIPALLASRTDVNRVLKEGAVTGTNRRGAHVLRTMFLSVQLALVVVLMAQLGLVNLLSRSGPPTDAAVATTEVVAASVTLPPEKYPSPVWRLAFYDHLSRQVNAAPGMVSSALASATPLGGAVERHLALTDGSPATDATAPTVWTVAVGPDYFKTLNIGLVRGHEFLPSAESAASADAIVNERFAAMFLGDSDPIGRPIRLTAAGSGSAASTLTIIGVAPSIRQRPNPDPDPIVYVRLDREAPSAIVLLARAQGDTAQTVRALQEAARTVDSNLPLYRMRTLARVVEEAEWNGRVSSRLALTLTLLSVVLAGVGLYAVGAQIVAHRTREIALRMALGAGWPAVAGLMLHRVRAPLWLGCLAGAAGIVAWDAAFSTGRAGLRATAPASLALTAAMVAGIVFVACWVPMRRAMRVDPSAALRRP